MEISQIKTAKKLNNINESITLALNDLSNKLKLEGRDIISLTAGEPDFNTPDYISSSAIKAINEHKTRYTSVTGIQQLKDAIVHKLKNENKLEYKLNEVMASVGGKQAISNAFTATLNPGDEVIIPAPYWTSYPEMVKINDANPVIINTTLENNFKINAESLKAAISDKTKMLIINSPSNPTGFIYNSYELKEISEILLAYPKILILSDDIYEHIRFDKKPCFNILNICPELKPRTIIVNGVSKAYAMTGWRLGYAAANANIISKMAVIQSQTTSSPCSISQYAAETALRSGLEFTNNMRDEFHTRAKFVFHEINKINGLTCPMPEGAFYCFIDSSASIEQLYKNKEISEPTDLEFSKYLLNKSNVVVVPGSAFGAPNCFRISIACSMAEIKNAIQRLSKIL